MSLRMHTAMPAVLPSELSVSTAAGTDSIRLVGPGMWGLIYRSVNGPFSYRVLPGDTPVQQIHSMRKWVGALPRRFLAPVEEVNNSWHPKRVFDFVRYKVGNSAISLAEALRHTDPAFR